MIAATGETTPYAAKALADEVQAVMDAEVGTRNHRLNVAAFNLGQIVAAGEITAVEVVAALTQAGVSVGLRGDEVRKTVASGIGAGQKHPRDIPVLHADVQSVSAEEISPSTPTEAQAIEHQFPVLDWRSLFEDDDEQQEWILEPLIPARRLVAVYSAPKVGKSLLMLEIAVAIARGHRALGNDVERRRVLYVDYENDPRGDVVNRLRAMGISHHHLSELKYLSFPRFGGLDTPQGAATLMAVVQHYACEVVVIDTVSRAVRGEENENDTWLNFYRCTGMALKEAGITCVRLDHSGKDADKGMRGGSAKYSDVDAVWRLTEAGGGGDNYRLTCTDNRLPITEKEIVFKRERFPLRHTVYAEGRAAIVRQEVADLIAALDAAGAADDIGRPAASKILKAAGISHNSATKTRSGYPTPLAQAIEQRRRRVVATPATSLGMKDDDDDATTDATKDLS